MGACNMLIFVEAIGADSRSRRSRSIRNIV